MRILFTFAGGSGHLEPLVPIAWAAQAAGHTVALVGRPWMVPKIEALGFRAFAAGSDRGLTPVKRPLLKVDLERELQSLRDGFARRIARERARDLLPLCGEWRPDLLVWEETDFCGAVIAERLGLPHASVLVAAAGSFVRPSLVAEPLNELRAEYGLPLDPDLAMLSRYLVLSPFPPSFRDPAFPLPSTAHSIRPFALDPADSPIPSWLANLHDTPIVYFTLGTVFNMECGDLFTRVLAGLRELPIHLIVTVGRDIDPTELGPQPANVHIKRYIPQAQLLPRCAAMVSHGGSGSVTGALVHGLPMVLLPMGADQPLNAARCAELGLARVLDVVEATSGSIREAVELVLTDPSYRQATERMREEAVVLPGPEYAVTLLERLVAEPSPID